MTGDDLIALAMRAAGLLGTGQTALSQDTSDALLYLNNLLALWQRRRWLVPSLTDVSCTSTGAMSYSIATGGDFDTPRPDRIEAAYARYLPTQTSSFTLDWPVEMIDAHEDYADLQLKALGYAQNGVPGRVFYDSSYPTGHLYWWPIPSSSYELHVLVKATVGPITDTTAAISLPAEHIAALTWCLADDLISAWALDARPDITAKARAALETIRGANLQVPELELPLAVRGFGGWSVGHRPWAGGPWIPDPSTLPTTLPSTAGVYWNNGGLVSIS
jgi:hypothetical protein